LAHRRLHPGTPSNQKSKLLELLKDSVHTDSNLALSQVKSIKWSNFIHILHLSCYTRFHGKFFHYMTLGQKVVDR